MPYTTKRDEQAARLEPMRRQPDGEGEDRRAEQRRRRQHPDREGIEAERGQVDRQEQRDEAVSEGTQAAQAASDDGTPAAPDDRPVVPPAVTREPRRVRFGIAPRVLVTGVLVLVALSWLAPYLSDRALTRSIVLASDNHPAAAVAQAHRAHRLDPLAVDPLFTLALVEQQHFDRLLRGSQACDKGLGIRIRCQRLGSKPLQRASVQGHPTERAGRWITLWSGSIGISHTRRL